MLLSRIYAIVIVRGARRCLRTSTYGRGGSRGDVAASIARVVGG